MDYICTSARRPTCYFEAMGMPMWSKRERVCYNSVSLPVYLCSFEWTSVIFCGLCLTGEPQLKKVIESYFLPPLTIQGAFQQGTKPPTALVEQLSGCQWNTVVILGSLLCKCVEIVAGSHCDAFFYTFPCINQAFKETNAWQTQKYGFLLQGFAFFSSNI